MRSSGRRNVDPRFIDPLAASRFDRRRHLRGDAANANASATTSTASGTTASHHEPIRDEARLQRALRSATTLRSHCEVAISASFGAARWLLTAIVMPCRTRRRYGAGATHGLETSKLLCSKNGFSQSALKYLSQIDLRIFPFLNAARGILAIVALSETFRTQR